MQEAIRVEKVSLTYAGSQVKALEEVDFVLPRGVRAALVGPNGAGKSSLMKVLLGLEPVSEGRISLLGQSTNLAKLLEQKVAYVPQANQVNWSFPATVFEMILMGRFAHAKGFLRRPSQHDREIAEQAMQRMGLDDLRYRQIDQLSGGQRQRVFIARALCQEAELYLLDEPLAGVDRVTEQIIMDTLEEFQKEGKTSLVIHHDLSTVASYFDYLVWFNRSVIASGPVDQVWTNSFYEKTYGRGLGLPVQEGRND